MCICHLLLLFNDLPPSLFTAGEELTSPPINGLLRSSEQDIDPTIKGFRNNVEQSSALFLVTSKGIHIMYLTKYIPV